jgi:hypothetical protein
MIGSFILSRDYIERAMEGREAFFMV